MSRGNWFWAAAGVAGFGALLFLVFHFQSGRTASERLELRKVELAGQIRVALASAAEAEKSAVLAVTDKESAAFAGQARAATATAEDKRLALGELLRAGGPSNEKETELLAQFSNAFSEFQRVDRELLELAVQNTNVKATALAFGPAAASIQELDVALSLVLEENAQSNSSDAKTRMLAAARAQAAALRIQALLPVHIAEESDAKMDALERRMDEEDSTVRENLAALNAGIAARYARFTEQKKQILALSRKNTNLRSLSISLNQKRKVTVLCQDALAALDQALADARLTGVAEVHSRPR
jgi:hypothetical protein